MFFQFFTKLKKIFQKWQEINDNSMKIIGPAGPGRDFFRDAVVFDRSGMDVRQDSPK